MDWVEVARLVEVAGEEEHVNVVVQALLVDVVDVSEEGEPVQPLLVQKVKDKELKRLGTSRLSTRLRG